MANMRGVLDTSKYESGIKKLDVRDMIFQLQPDATPFFSILAKVGKFRAVDTGFSWFEDDLLGNYTQLNMAGDAAADLASIIVDDATIFQEGDLIQVVDTNEVMLVTAINDTTQTLTVKRGWGVTAGAIIHNNDYLYKLGNSQQEGYNAPESLVTGKVKKTNYVQIFSKTVMITETADKVAVFGGNRRNFERNKKAVELKREIESQMLWGEPKEDTASFAQPRYQTGGIYYFLSTVCASLDMSTAALTESAWEGFLKDLFLYSEADRYAFMGPLPLSQISQFASPKQRFEGGKDTTYGIKVTKYHSAMGDVNLVLDRHFIGPHAGKILLLDPKQLTYRFLEGLDWSLALNIQPTNAHYIQDEYSATIGLEIHNAKLHGFVKGIA